MAESGALTEPHMVALREAYQLCKKEYAVRTDKDRGEVMALGGLHFVCVCVCVCVCLSVCLCVCVSVPCPSVL